MTGILEIPRTTRNALVVAIWVVGAGALAYLAVEHRPHLVGWLPYLIILACPLMHLFMHRGHHHDDH